MSRLYKVFGAFSRFLPPDLRASYPFSIPLGVAYALPTKPRYFFWGLPEGLTRFLPLLARSFALPTFHGLLLLRFQPPSPGDARTYRKHFVTPFRASNPWLSRYPPRGGRGDRLPEEGAFALSTLTSALRTPDVGSGWTGELEDLSRFPPPINFSGLLRREAAYLLRPVALDDLSGKPVAGKQLPLGVDDLRPAGCSAHL